MNTDDLDLPPLRVMILKASSTQDSWSTYLEFAAFPFFRRTIQCFRRPMT